MTRKRLKRKPTRSEISDAPLRPWKRDYKHYHDGGPGGDAEIAMHVGKGNPGRPPGALNKTTRQVKEGAILAAELRGHSKDGTLTGYLQYLADEFPITFARSILSRLIPYNLRVQADMRVETREEIRAKLLALGVPVPEYLFSRPQVPRPDVPVLQHQPNNGEAKPAVDEDDLQREPLPAVTNRVSEPTEPPRHENIYSPNHKPPPARPHGEMPLGAQYELNWPSTFDNMDLMCGSIKPPARLVVDNKPDEETTDETPQAAGRLRR
jgi:hypothetical protein